MDNYHEDLIVVLEEIKLHHLQKQKYYSGSVAMSSMAESYCDDRFVEYHKERAEFIQSELDRLTKKYS
jgi:hypothetical protein